MSDVLRRVRGVCPRQAKAVSIEGHPVVDFNGVYTHDSTHKGWPVLKNVSGKYCSRYTPNDEWQLCSDPTKSASVANIVAKEGLLPVGAHTWRVWVDGEWVDGTLTVGLLVRPPLASPAACASSYGAWPSNTNELACSDGG